MGDKRYQLTQFHFHRPSEEYIDGKPYDMEVHLMYQASDGKVAGVTVFVKPGAANSIIQKVWEHMSKAEGQQEVAGVEINPAGLLPEKVRYYMYMGSLTAPPCTENTTRLSGVASWKTHLDGIDANPASTAGLEMAWRFW